MKYLVTLLLSIFFLACDKDTEKEFELTNEFLTQTCWQGSIRVAENNSEILKGEIGILFSTNKDGNYEFMYQNDKIPTHDAFQYKVNRNIITISNAESGYVPSLRGDWLVTEKGKDKLVIVRGMNNIYSSSTTLSLTRIY